jgi:hypothetical protein
MNVFLLYYLCWYVKVCELRSVSHYKNFFLFLYQMENQSTSDNDLIESKDNIAHQQVDLPCRPLNQISREVLAGNGRCLFHAIMTLDTARGLRIDMPTRFSPPMAIIRPQRSTVVLGHHESGIPFRRVDYRIAGRAGPNGPPVYLVEDMWCFNEVRRIPGPNPFEDLVLLFCQSNGMNPSCNAIGYLYRSRIYVFGFHSHGPPRIVRVPPLLLHMMTPTPTEMEHNHLLAMQNICEGLFNTLKIMTHFTENK